MLQNLNVSLESLTEWSEDEECEDVGQGDDAFNAIVLVDDEQPVNLKGKDTKRQILILDKLRAIWMIFKDKQCTNAGYIVVVIVGVNIVDK